MTQITALNTGMPVAIVGIGCRFPGGVTDVTSYWRLLIEGRDAITEIPADRIDIAHYFDPRPATPGRMMTRWGGFLERIDEFDALFFGISPLEAERMDPQQRLLLETAWEAIEDAGQDVARLEGSTTGVFLGQWLNDFEGRLFADPEEVDFYMTTGSGRYAASGRISYALGLRGPSLTLDTACSSSLTAVHLAVRSIRNGESTMALAGGVNVILQPHISIAYSQSRMMAPDGRCKFGDASGDGYVRSEGVALVVLKPLQRALADGDRIYAVIRGSALNNDGRSSGSMGTPSRVGQEELLRSAYRDAGLPASRVGYIEAHGTGTRAGDPVELSALGAVLGEGRSPEQRAFVGSVKTNFGHTEGAAGVAGLVKVALALHHGEIPQSLHCRELNPLIPWTDAGFAIARARTNWPDISGPRVAGVSSFGIAGTNAHIVLEQAPPSKPVSKPSLAPRALALLPLSTRSPEALRALAGRYAELLKADEGPALPDVCWSAMTRRTALPQRAAFVAADRPSMVQTLLAYASGDTATAEGDVLGERPKLAFVIPGQGAQWTGMARVLMENEPIFRAALRRCDEAARPWIDWSIIDQLKLDPGSANYRLDQIDVIQPVLIALAIAYAELWRSLGIEPDAVVGHSMGEVGAAYIAGAINLEQAMQVICRRSALMSRMSGQGAMALVELSMADAQTLIKGREEQVSVAVNNSPRSSVISGDPATVQQILTELESKDVFCRLVKVDVASHSPQMEPLAHELVAELAELEGQASRVPMYSTVLGKRCDGPEFNAEYWGRNLRQPVRFTDAVDRLLDDGVSVFLELSPHPLLSMAVRQIAEEQGHEAATLVCGRREEPEMLELYAALAGLWAVGVTPCWSAVVPGEHRNVSLPLYSWQRERYWVDAAEAIPVTPRGQQAIRVARPDDESLSWLYRQEWSALPDLHRTLVPAAASSNWIIVSDDESALASLGRAAGGIGFRCQSSSVDGLAPAIERHVRSDIGPVDALIVVASDDQQAPYLPLSALQAVLKVPSARPRLWFVTRGAQYVADGAPSRVLIGHAALWGAGRVVAEEHPELWGGLVDLDPAVSWDDAATALVAHIRQPDGEDQVALRGASRYGLRLVRYSPQNRHLPFAWRSDAAYLISGGQGDIGFHLAHAMVAQGARRLILLGRTPLPPRDQWNSVNPDTVAGYRVEAIRTLEAAGAAIHVAAVDVADEVAMRDFLDRYRDEAWPPIRGVIHLAGSFNNRLASNMDRAAFDTVLASKLVGAQLLDRLFPELDLFMLFSSTGAFLVQPGQANYAAANAGLDAVAFNRRARGLTAQSIAWGVWQGTGLVKDAAGERNVGEMERQGIQSLTPVQGTAMFSWLCRLDEPSLAVLPIDWARFREACAGREVPMFRDLMVDVSGAAFDSGASDLGSRLANSSPTERRKLVEAVVRDTLGKVLKIAPARIDPRKALGAMGLGSLMAVELRNRLEAAIGRSLSATLAWNYPTVEALVGYLASDQSSSTELATNASETTGADAASAEPVGGSVDAALAKVTELSDEEAALALLGKRGKRVP